MSKLARSAWPLAIILGFFALIGYGISTISFVSTTFEKRIFDLPFCLQDKCVGDWLLNFKYSLSIAKATGDFLVATATAGGIVIALMSYRANVNTAALSNHIAHFSIFQSYLNNEISKRNRIASSSIDILRWYNHIFSTSQGGNTNVSVEYRRYVESLNDLISQSNEQATRAMDGSFRYTAHQKRVKDFLRLTGIDIEFQPRNDFFEIEGQVLDLIGGVNRSFCFKKEVPEIIVRKYI